MRDIEIDMVQDYLKSNSIEPNGNWVIYDKDIMIANSNGDLAARTQFKEVFGLGLSYKF